MNMINVMGSTNGIVLYNGDVVTCYPGSNQTDKGKLQLEFNMARFVTRLSSKNFCVTNPSFVITTRQSTVTGIEQLVVSSGQASINGMDLIITDSIAVNPPETTGTYYLVLRLQRSDDNGNGNVLGDLTIGVQTIFQGVCLSYYDEKPDPIDPDFLYLAEITWDGEHFTSIIEDEDKYGRIWAEDILCKINDPKHPNIRRLLLQDLIYNIPDWYVSKEGDVEFEAIEWLPGRQNGAYTSADYGTGKYGYRIEATSDNEALVNFKAPSILTSNANLTVQGQATNTKLHWDIGQIDIDINSTNNYILDIDTPNKIDVQATNDVVLKSTTDFKIIGGYVTNELTNHKSSVTDSTYTNLKDETEFINANVLRKTLGKARMQYDSSSTTLSIYKTDTASTPNNVLTNLNIDPNVNLTNDLTVGGDVTVTGGVTASKVWNAVYNDYAEYFKKASDEVIEVGDIICLREDGLAHKVSAEEDLDRIIGICSNTAGMILGGKDLLDVEKVLVGMVGKIWVKTDDVLKPGDLVQATNNGVVVKTYSKHDKLGIAMSNTIEGKVLIVYNG